MELVARRVDCTRRKRIIDWDPNWFSPSPIIGDDDRSSSVVDDVPAAGPTSTTVSHAGPVASPVASDSGTITRALRRPEKNKQKAAGPGLAHAISKTGFAFRQLVTIVETAAQLPDAPPEPAGPLTGAERTAKDLAKLTMSNAVGNVRLYRTIDKEPEIRVWVLRALPGDGAAWVAADDREAHPSLDGYVLSLRNVDRPSWVTIATRAQYDAPSKQK